MTEEIDPFFVPSTSDMAFQTKTFILRGLLDKASSALPLKSPSPIVTNFLIELKEGKIRVTATDLELSVVAVTEVVSIEREGRAVFPGRRLIDLVKESGDSELDIDVSEGKARISSSRTTWEFFLMSDSGFPNIPDTSEVDFHEVPRENFLEALLVVRYAACSDATRPPLMRINVKDGKMRAADGVRFQEIDVGGWWPNTVEMDIPYPAVDDLVRLLKSTERELISVGQADDHIVFLSGADLFLANKLSGKFPDVEALLLKPTMANKDELLIDRSTLIGAIRRVRVTADQETSAVVFLLSADSAEISARDSRGNLATEKIDVKWTGQEGRKAAFNYQFLLDMLASSQALSCQFFLGKDKKSQKSLLLLKDDVQQTRAVLSQVRAEFLE